MKRFGVPRYRYLLMIPALLALIALAAWFRVPKSVAHRYQPIENAIVNPLCGLAIDAAEDPASVSREYSLVYVHATWRELEPEKGEYDFESFERKFHIDQWLARGARLILRLSLDEPGTPNLMDIPDWLYAETGDGVFYQTVGGEGYSPDYSNLTLQDAHGKLLEALAKRYEGSGALAYVEMGSLGHYGEWYTDREGGAPALPMTDVTSVYIWQYYSAFQKTAVLARGPYREAMLSQGGAYTTSLGDESATWDWVNLFAFGGWDDQLDAELRPQDGFGLKTPSGAWMQRGIDIASIPADALIRMAEECRASYVCGDFERTEAARESGEALAGEIGYRYWVRQADWPGRVHKDYSLYIDLTIRNDGVAPICRSWPVEIALLQSGEAAHRERVEADPMKWLPGDSALRVRITIPSAMKASEYSLAIALIDPSTGEPGVRLAMEGETIGLWSVLGTVLVN